MDIVLGRPVVCPFVKHLTAGEEMKTSFDLCRYHLSSRRSSVIDFAFEFHFAECKPTFVEKW